MILDHITKFPKLMGILNVTPDSFSDGGKFYSVNDALNHCKTMIDSGAEIIDVGGESTRPGADIISVEDELERVVPIIKEIHKSYPEVVISIDTTKFDVAKAALDSGASIINDVSGLNHDIRLLDLAIEYKAKLIIMHMKGNPRNMQIKPEYNNLIEEVYNSLKDKIDLCNKRNFFDLIIDVGIGFGKSLDHNLLLLKNLDKFNKLNAEQLLGISRKSFIGKLFNKNEAHDRDFETLLFHSLLLSANLDYIRVHNLNFINQLKKVYTYLK